MTVTIWCPNDGLIGTLDLCKPLIGHGYRCGICGSIPRFEGDGAPVAKKKEQEKTSCSLDLPCDS